MSESKAPARPRQVTMAGGFALVGSALLVLTLFDSMSQVRSVEMRESIDDFLSTSPGSGLGLDASQILGILRGTMLFAGAAAAAATVLAVYVLQRHQGARIGFTVAAVAIMFTAPITGSPFSVLVAAAAMMLWTRPARDWFAGRAAAPAKTEQKGIHVSSEKPPPGENSAPDNGGTPAWPRMPDASSEHQVPPPTQGFGGPAPSSPAPDQSQPPAQEGQAPYGQPPYGQAPYGQDPYGQDPYRQAPYGQAPYGQEQPSQSWPPSSYGGQPQQYAGYPAYGQPQNSDRRPVTVTVAAWLTWAAALLTFAGFGVVVMVMLVASDQFIDSMQAEPEFQQLNLATGDVIAALWVMSAISLFWCVASFVLAVLAYRRVNWARITLVVSAAFACILSLAAFPVGLLHAVVAGATIVLLFTGGANDWYSRKGGGYPSYPQQGGQQYPQQWGAPPVGPPQGQAPQYGGQPPQPPHGQQQGPPESGDQQDQPKNVW